MQVRNDVQIIEEIVEELKIKREFKILHKKSKAIYTRSPFYDRYYTQFVVIENHLKDEESGIDDITNCYYALKFMEYITLEFMPYIPICSALLLNFVNAGISRISNATVECFNRII